MTIELKAENLNSRIPAMAQLLRPLRKGEVACQFCALKRNGGRVIAAHSGNQSNASDYREWWFSSFVPFLWCQYFELWKPDERQYIWSLDRAYLHIKRISQDSAGQDLIMVHCDPADDEKHKQGPHLHFEATYEEVLRRSHFPLNLSELERVLSSLEALTEALSTAVQVVVKEVIGRYEDDCKVSAH